MNQNNLDQNDSYQYEDDYYESQPNNNGGEDIANQNLNENNNNDEEETFYPEYPGQMFCSQCQQHKDIVISLECNHNLCDNCATNQIIKPNTNNSQSESKQNILIECGICQNITMLTEDQKTKIKMENQKQQQQKQDKPLVKISIQQNTKTVLAQKDIGMTNKQQNVLSLNAVQMTAIDKNQIAKIQAQSKPAIIQQDLKQFCACKLNKYSQDCKDITQAQFQLNSQNLKQFLCSKNLTLQHFLIHQLETSNVYLRLELGDEIITFSYRNKFQENFSSAFFSPDSQKIAIRTKIVDQGKVIQQITSVYDVKTYDMLKIFENTIVAQFLPDGKSMAINEWNEQFNYQQIKIFDFEKKQFVQNNKIILQSKNYNDDQIKQVFFSPNQKYVVISAKNIAIMKDFKTQEDIVEIIDQIVDVCFSNDSDKFAISTAFKGITIYNSYKGDVYNKIRDIDIQTKQANTLYNPVFSVDDKKIFALVAKEGSHTENFDIKQFDCSSGNMEGVFQYCSRLDLGFQNKLAVPITVSQDEYRITCNGAIWDITVH